LGAARGERQKSQRTGPSGSSAFAPAPLGATSSRLSGSSADSDTLVAGLAATVQGIALCAEP